MKDLSSFKNISYLLLPVYIWYRRRNLSFKRDLLSDTISILGGDMFISRFFNNIINDIIETVKKLIDKNYGISELKKIDNEAKELMATETDFSRMKILSRIRKVVSHNIGDRDIDILKNFLEIFKSLDLKPKRIEQFDKTELLSGYTNADLLEEIVDNMILTSQGKSMNKAIYLLGEPGTGKTRFVNNLSKATNIPIIDKILSNEAEHYTGNYMITPPMLGKFSSEMINYGISNPIIFIDEFDKLLDINSNGLSRFINELLMITEPTTGKYRCGCSGLEFDMTKCTLIIAGNKLPESNALLNRLQVIEFPAMSRENRITVAKDQINKYSKLLNFDHETDDEDMNVIDKIIEVDKNDGVRVLIIACTTYVCHLYKQSLGFRTSFDPEVFISRYRKNK